MSFDWIEFSCAEALLDEPTEWVCPCGGEIVHRIDEEDLFCWACCTRYELSGDQ
jgi:hypothetical protein